MRIDLKGLHWTKARLADGSTKIYWYAWRGSKRLEGELGTPEFIASYNAAVAGRAAPPEGRLQSLIFAYQKTQDFLRLRERTRADCSEAQIATITGHSLSDVRSILDAHYLHRDPELAREAIHKLETRYAKPTD